jgi:hypothetical protein
MIKPRLFVLSRGCTGVSAARRESGLTRHSGGSLLSLNELVNCFFRCATRTSGTNVWSGMICESD